MLCVELGCYYQLKDSVEGDFLKSEQQAPRLPFTGGCFVPRLNVIGRVLFEMF